MSAQNFYISKTFLSLTAEAQRAFMLAVQFSDDDGFFETFPLEHIYGIKRDVFNELHACGVASIHSDDITRIIDIKQFKPDIRSDRYKPSKYCETFNVEPLQFEKRPKKTNDSHMGVRRQPSVNTVGDNVETIVANNPETGKPAVIVGKLPNRSFGIQKFKPTKESSKENNINNNIYTKHNNFLGKSENPSLLEPVAPQEDQAETPQESNQETQTKKPKVAGGRRKGKTAKKLSDGQVLGELAIFMTKHNDLHGTKRKATKGMYGNWRTIRETYSLDEIVQSYENCVNSSFYSHKDNKMIYWRDILKEDPIRFLRTRNDKGPVDPVGRFLEKPEVAEEPKKSGNANFQNQRGADYYKNMQNKR